MGRQLSGAVLGILGYGAIGRHLGRLGTALGMEVLAADPFAAGAEPGVTLRPMAEVLARADFLVCLVVANDSTDNLMDAAAFAAMRRGSYFLNLSRGQLVDEAALEAALDSGQLAGAALDVGGHGDQMPPPRLAARPNVVATPHIGGLTQQAVDHQAFETTRQAAAILRGEAPAGSMNDEAASRLARMRG
jgi:D-3-phosphoglycerate dehydrogenase